MRRNSFVYALTRFIGQRVFPLFYEVEIEGGTALPLKSPAVILPKHQYWTDIPLVGLSFKFPLYFVAKIELFKYVGIRSFLELLGGIPVDRSQSIRTLSSMRALLSLLKEGERVVIFPEGTYVRSAVGPGKNRLIQMILNFQPVLKQTIPFIPLGIRYGERVGWRRKVEIRIGSPLFAESESDPDLLTRRMMGEIASLSRLPLDETLSGNPFTSVASRTDLPSPPVTKERIKARG